MNIDKENLAHRDDLDKGEAAFEKDNWPNLKILGQELFFEETLIDENDLDKRGLPWKGGLQGESDQGCFEQLHKLVSLWDMIRIKINVLSNILELLQQIEFGGDAHYRHIDSLGIPKLRYLNDEVIDLIKDRLTKIQCEFEKLELTGGISEQIQYILNNANTMSPERYHENIKSLRYLIKQELSKQSFLFMPQEDVKWYKKQDLFGPEVSDSFQEAIKDIEDAGSCFAAGLYTACVFHLMRVVEYALRALAKERKVILPKGKPLEYATWHTIIEQISKKANEIDKRAIPGPKKEEALSFYRGLVGEFSAFKDVYRNHVMHTRVNYEHRYEVERILMHVKGFMERLSLRISEKKRTPINWKLKYNP